MHMSGPAPLPTPRRDHDFIRRKRCGRLSRVRVSHSLSSVYVLLSCSCVASKLILPYVPQLSREVLHVLL
jgi:hypothetical protein